jgi:hypothetical protein
MSLWYSNYRVEAINHWDLPVALLNIFGILHIFSKALPFLDCFPGYL